MSVPGETMCVLGPKERRVGKAPNPQGAVNEGWGLPLKTSAGLV